MTRVRPFASAVAATNASIDPSVRPIFCPRHNYTPSFGNMRINVENACFEPHGELFSEPCGQPLAAAPGR